MLDKSEEVNLEFSRPLDVTMLPQKKKQLSFKATTNECVLLATRLGCVSIDYFESDVAIQPYDRTDFIAEVSFRSKVTQECVVTLEPVYTSIETSVRLRLVPNSDLCDADSFYESHDYEIENFSGDVIDMGELLTQYLCLEIPLSPRSENAPTSEGAGATPDSQKDSPFQVLSSLKIG